MVFYFLYNCCVIVLEFFEMSVNGYCLVIVLMVGFSWFIDCFFDVLLGIYSLISFVMLLL